MAPTTPRRRLGTVAGHVLAPWATAAASEIPHYEPGKHFGVLPDYEHKIVMPEAGIASAKTTPPETFAILLAKAAEYFPDDVALTAEQPAPEIKGPGEAPSLPWEEWKKVTWGGYYRSARGAAKAFIALGVEQFGCVSIFGFNAPQWSISLIGAMLCGAKGSGIYSTDTPEQVQYKVLQSGTSVVVVDGEKEFDSVASKIEEMPGLKAIAVWGMPPPADLKRANGSICRIFSWEGLLGFGDAEGSETLLDQRIANTRPGHTALLIYTSGTTGNPKAVMLSHDAVVAQCSFATAPENGMMAAFEEDDSGRILSYLPLSHIAGSLMDILMPLYAAGKIQKKSTTYFARPYDLKEMTLAARIQFVKPTIWLAVPRVYEKMQARIMAVAATITGIKKSIATWAKGKGLEYTRNLQLGGSGARPLFHSLADKLILSKARENLGLSKCKIFVTGAAPISTETLEYFGALGMVILNMYGMSESSGVTTSCTPMRNSFGTVGSELNGTEVKCFKTGPSGENVEVPRCKPGAATVPEEQQGEICFRGRHIMSGYLANPSFGPEHVKEMEDKTSSAIDALGWLHSGDKGCMDTNGMVRITGRYKELIIGAGGENIAPVPVEESLKQECPALSNVMMVGDRRKYNVALVTLLVEGSTGEAPGGDHLTGVALQVNPQVTTVSQAMLDPVWHKYIQDGLDRTNSNPNVCQNNAWKIQKFAILPRDFSIQTGEFTPSLKLKRSVAEEMWIQAIDSMFTE